MFVFGAWFALGGTTELRAVTRSRVALYGGIGYLMFSFAMTAAGRLPGLGGMLPQGLLEAFNPGDKTDLTPYRLLHFVVIAVLVLRFAPRQWRGLQWRILGPVVKCGQSIAVFCVGLFLSLVAQFVVTMSSGSPSVQIVAGISGVAIMIVVAYYISWSKKQDEGLLRRPASAHLP